MEPTTSGCSLHKQAQLGAAAQLKQKIENNKSLCENYLL